MVYKHVIVAGTFDGLHQGHKMLLRFAFSVGENVYVTITSDVYTKAHKPYAATFEKRKKAVEDFLRNEKIFSRAIIMSIDDVYGIAIDKNLPIDALIVTDETKSGGVKVNAKRQELGLSPLPLIFAPMTIGETGLRISSSQLKTGIIDEKGTIDMKKKFASAQLTLPEILREKLQEPFGSLVDISEMRKLDPSKLIAVGDVTTKTFHDAGIQPMLSLIDFVIERRPQNHDVASLGIRSETIFFAKNPHGTLTPSLWESLEKAFSLIQQQKKVVIIVEGEEDLAVLPLMLLCPMGWIICYGQPHVGMVAIPIIQDTKEQAIALLSEFTR